MKCPKCKHKNPEWAKFCINCGTKFESSKPLHGERRTVTILFSDFKGFTSISENLDVEELQEMIGKVFKLFEPLIETSGGWLDKYMGDAVMAVFGVPTSHEDDPQRAIHCAIKMQETLQEFNHKYHTDLAMRIGINTGEVIAGKITEKGGYTVMGDAVNVAQRLESISKPGKITVGEKAKRLSTTAYRFRKLPVQKVKGRETPVQPYEVIERIKTSKISTFRTPLVAREKEFDLIKRTLLETMDKRTFRIILISGEPGTGKTRLFEEFKMWLAGLTESVKVSEGRCIAYGGSPLWPIGELIRSEYHIPSDAPLRTAREKLFNGLKNHLQINSSVTSAIDRENIIHLIGSQIGIDFPDARIRALSPQTRWESAKRAFRLWIEQLAQKQPFVMTIEDAHRSDSTTIELIEEITRYWTDFPCTTHCGIVIFILARPEFLEKNPKWTKELPELVHIPIQTLDNIGAKELVEKIIGKCDEKLINFVFKETGGNPYYTQEFISFLQEKKLLETVKKCSRISRMFTDKKMREGVIPDTLRGLLTARIDMLKPSEKEVLQNASVVGTSFWEKLLSKLIEREVKTELKGLKGKEYVRELPESSFAKDIEYMFKHALLRDAAYTGLTKRERKRLHSLIAEWIVQHLEEKPELSALAASHFEAGGLIDKAVEWWKKAADRAKEEYHNKEAIAYYERLLQIVETQEQRAKILLDKGGVHQLIGELALAEEHYNEALRIAEKVDVSSPIFPEAANSLGQFLIFKANYDSAMKYLELAKEQFDKIGHKKGMASAIGNIGIVHDDKCNYDKAIECYEKQFQLSEEIIDKKGIQHAIMNMGTAYFHKGNYDKAIQCFQKSLKLSEELGDKSAMAIIIGNIGNVYDCKANYDKAMECHQKSLLIAQEIGAKRRISATIGNMGVVYTHKGCYDKAIECYEKSLKLSEELGNKRGMAHNIGNIGYIYALKSDYNKSIECFNKQFQISEKLGDKRQMSIAIGNIGLSYRNKGNYDRAIECHQKSLLIAQEIGGRAEMLYAIGNMGIVYYDKGNYDKAIECYEKSLHLAQEIDDKQGMSTAIGNMGGVYYDKGDYDKAMEFYEKAISIGREFGIKYPLCLYLQSKAKLLFILNKIDEANAVNKEALDIASEIEEKSTIFNANLLSAKIDSVKDVNKGISIMQAMLKETNEDGQIANIYYEIWKLNQDGKYRNKASKLFNKLYKSTPKVDYHKKLKEMKDER